MLELLLDKAVLGSLVLALLVLVVLPRLVLISADKQTVPVYGPRYLPPFVRGILALYRLGADEDGFLHELRRDYPVAVCIPWPMQKTFVVGSRAIDQVYKAPAKTLSFVSSQCSLCRPNSTDSHVVPSSRSVEKCKRLPLAATIGTTGA